MRGTPEHLSHTLPAELVQGIILHRSIDCFTDSHPLFLSSKELLSPARRRFAGIIIDIFFDHFLVKSWDLYSKFPLDRFVREIYEMFERRREWLTLESVITVRKMKEQNWIGNYQTIAGLSLTFQQVSRRRPFLEVLIGAEEDLAENYLIFQKTFHDFYPALINHVEQENPGGAFNSA